MHKFLLLVMIASVLSFKSMLGHSGKLVPLRKLAGKSISNNFIDFSNSIPDLDRIVVNNIESATGPGSNMLTKIVLKSKFDEFVSILSPESLAILNSKKFPGNKVIRLPNAELVIFCNDEEGEVDFTETIRQIGGCNSITCKQFDNTELPKSLAEKFVSAWASKCYDFSFFKGRKASDKKEDPISLVWPMNADKEKLTSQIKAETLMKDLVNTPPLSLGPKEFGDVVVQLCGKLNCTSIHSAVGVEQLLQEKYPQVAAVGMAAAKDREPRVYDVCWDRYENAPQVVLVGKGITFDTGGLNIKTGKYMRGMKGDMAGAAQALALAMMLVEREVKVNIRLILPIAENAINGNALRPDDVIKGRNGKTTEIVDTDAEGRLILADALAAGLESRPALMVNFATLTGSARVALGPDLPALFSNNEAEATKFWKLSSEVRDPVWLMPMWEPLRKSIESKIADHLNCAEGSQGDAIIAALYLSAYAVDKEASPHTTWFHIDFPGMNKDNMAQPAGMAAVFEYITRHVAGQTKNSS